MEDVARPNKRQRLDGVANHNPCPRNYDISATFAELSSLIISTITEDITSRKTPDSIHECGQAPLSILFDRPNDVLQLAKAKTYEWPFKDVPACWLRLCEDASLVVAAGLLGSTKSQLSGNDPSCSEELLSEVVKTIDAGIALSGQPRRKQLTHFCFEALQNCWQEQSVSISSAFSITEPETLKSDHEVQRKSFDFEDFQAHLDGTNIPIVLTGQIDHWPALSRWASPAYLVGTTLGGRRLALVEIGTSYADDGMRQELMTIKDFMDRYIMAKTVTEIGYIAQHDLLGHVDALGKDVQIPDLCYSTPPQTLEAAASGPRRNIWFGPAGTRSPFHTDPDSNMYCQVIGYKYFRLISPDHNDKMYARSTNEQGLDLSNQSQIIGFCFSDRYDLRHITASFHDFEQAPYYEVILGPGDCLYIPSRWWHFAESLSISIGVNFWWS